ncbi:hypothetical protein [Kozakia baliensis]|uniref:hypothetical protein n=1 Tax=Kozakia baliensis TaxID=153496 RepID=UPI00124633F0|nr:hypothetical protein [Kozakia baliensis]
MRSIDDDGRGAAEGPRLKTAEARARQLTRVRRYLIRRAVVRRVVYNKPILMRLLFTSMFWAVVAFLFLGAEAFGDRVKYADFFRELTGFYSEQFSPLMLIFLGLAITITFVFFGTFTSFLDSQELAREEAARLFYTIFTASTSTLILTKHPWWYLTAFIGQLVFLFGLSCLINPPPRGWTRKITPPRKRGLFKPPR